MALTWDISGIDSHEDLLVSTGEEDSDGEPLKKLDGTTECFIWLSMVTGLGPKWSLDAKFAPEFYARLKTLEKMDGPLLTDGDGQRVEFTWEMVKRRIGLKTNAGTKTRTQFIKNAVISDMDRWVAEAVRDGRD